jgi:hypothetical protein
MLNIEMRNGCGQRSRLASRTRAPTRAITSSRHRRFVQTRAVLELQPLIESTQSTLNSAYAGLGLGAASFAGTFFVAPRFKEAFKEATAWKAIYEDLVKSDIKSITAEDAYLRVKRGYACVPHLLAIL